MSSIVVAVFYTTIGLLFDRGRDIAAEKLKGGDVTDQQFRNLIVREINEINSKLDGLARMDLLASTSFFKEGLVFLYKMFDKISRKTSGSAKTRLTEKDMDEENLVVSLRSSTGGLQPFANTESLAKRLKNLNLTDLDDSAKQSLSDAKDMFKDARRKATEAFANESLKTSDRVLAIIIRVMASILEKIDDPAEALETCRLCLEELHAIMAVQKSFNVEVKKGFKSFFNKDDRSEIVAGVCHVNCVIYKVTQLLGRGMNGSELLVWPSIDIGEEKLDPLRDSRMIRKLRDLNMEYCCMTWTFGQEGDDEHKLKKPADIAINSQSQFVVADKDGRDVKVFNSSGTFLYSLSPPTVNSNHELLFVPWSVATDSDDNVYVLVRPQKGGLLVVEWRIVYVFDKHGNLLRKFRLRGEFVGWYVTVNEDNHVFVLGLCDGKAQVDVYESNGRFVRSFPEGLLGNTTRITAANEGRVMMLELTCRSVEVFNAQGDYIHNITVQGDVRQGAMAFHRASQHLLVCSRNPDNESRGQVSIYTREGEFLHSIQLDTEKEPVFAGLAVSARGRIAVANVYEGKIHVL